MTLTVRFFHVYKYVEYHRKTKAIITEEGNSN